MKTGLLRIISLLLIPCLLTNQAVASFFSSNGSFAGSHGPTRTLQNIAFEYEALNLQIAASRLLGAGRRTPQQFGNVFRIVRTTLIGLSQEQKLKAGAIPASLDRQGKAPLSIEPFELFLSNGKNRDAILRLYSLIHPKLAPSQKLFFTSLTWLQDPANQRMWVAKDEAKVIRGFIWASVDMGQRQADLVAMAVEKMFQRKGWGTRLIETAMADILQSGQIQTIDAVDGSAFIDRDPTNGRRTGRMLTTKFGFQPVTDIKNGYRFQRSSRLWPTDPPGLPDSNAADSALDSSAAPSKSPLAMMPSTGAAKKITALHRRWVLVRDRADKSHKAQELLDRIKNILRYKLPQEEDARLNYTGRLLNAIWRNMLGLNLYPTATNAEEFTQDLRIWVTQEIEVLAAEFALAHKEVFRGEWAPASDEDHRALANLFKSFAFQAIRSFHSIYLSYPESYKLDDWAMSMVDYMSALFPDAFYAAHAQYDYEAILDNRLLAMARSPQRKQKLKPTSSSPNDAQRLAEALQTHYAELFSRAKLTESAPYVQFLEEVVAGNGSWPTPQPDLWNRILRLRIMEQWTQFEVGVAVEKSEQRVSQIESKILAILVRRAKFLGAQTAGPLTYNAKTRISAAGDIFNFSAATVWTLKRSGIRDIGDLVARIQDPAHALNGLSGQSSREILDAIEYQGLLLLSHTPAADALDTIGISDPRLDLSVRALRAIAPDFRIFNTYQFPIFTAGQLDRLSEKELALRWHVGPKTAQEIRRKVTQLRRNLDSAQDSTDTTVYSPAWVGVSALLSSVFLLGPLEWERWGPVILPFDAHNVLAFAYATVLATALTWALVQAVKYALLWKSHFKRDRWDKNFGFSAIGMGGLPFSSGTLSVLAFAAFIGVIAYYRQPLLRNSAAILRSA